MFGSEITFDNTYLIGPVIKFQFDDNKLSNILMSSDFQCEDSIIDRFGKCNNQLNHFYGSSKILHEMYYVEKACFIPDKVEFRVGKKCILLQIEKMNLLLEFSQSTPINSIPQYTSISSNISAEELDRLLSKS